ncbi:MAG: M18 family aminopeptidase [Oligosphaeraceae bacterium]
MPEQEERLREFLEASPTAFHAVRWLSRRFQEAGFQCLAPGEPWRLQAGGRYFTTRNGSSLIAFRLGADAPLDHARMGVCHTDSPALKLRLRDAVPAGSLLKVPVEVYGGATLAPWLDRPLLVAGRIPRRDASGRLDFPLVASPAPLAVIPNPPIHLASLNDGFRYNPQTQLAALLDLESVEALRERLLPGESQETPAELWNMAELFLADAQPPVAMGDLLQAPRLDNLTSAFALADALCAGEDSPQTLLGGFFDLEEVGLNFQSAGGDFLPSTLARLADALGAPSPQAIPRMMAASLCLSLDVAHAFHPNFPELFDEKDAPRLGKGPALKFHANQNFATTLPAAAVVQDLALRGILPLQTFTPRSDSRCGSTIGRMVAGSLGVAVADLGIPLWAMHSIRETASLRDVQSLTDLLQAFFGDTSPLPLPH